MSPTQKNTDQHDGIWPRECEESYERIRLLGRGGFSFVWLARLRDFDDKTNNNNNNNNNCQREHEAGCQKKCLCGCIAIKVICASDKMKNAYVDREIEILRELNHQHITKFVKEIDIKSTSSKKKNGSGLMSPFRCIILSFENGPTLEELIKSGGALGIPFTQIIFKQLVSAVAYMHSHAVMHRDIKPDNIIVNGANFIDDSCWNDDKELVDSDSIAKWQVKLIDFGFTRALSPEQITKGNTFLKRSINGCNRYDKIAYISSTPTEEAITLPLEDTAARQSSTTNNVDDSISKKQVLDLSALGSRDYAAPEIKKGVRAYLSQTSLSLSSSLQRSSQRQNRTRKTLSENVSDYGMTADAFSIGATLRYALTGVPPHLDVNEYLAMRNSPLLVSLRMVKKVTNSLVVVVVNKGKKKKKNESQRRKKKRFRSYDDIPKEAARLVRGLTLWNPVERTTVRAAQFYPWLWDSAAAAAANDEESSSGDGQDVVKQNSRSHIKYLNCCTLEDDVKLKKQKKVVICQEQ